jgi:hypothetical protein
MALAVGSVLFKWDSRATTKAIKRLKILDGSARGMRAAAVPIKHVSEQVK